MTSGLNFFVIYLFIFKLFLSFRKLTLLFFLGGGENYHQVSIPASSFVKRRDSSSSSLSKQQQDAAMSDASTIDKEPADSEFTKKNGSSSSVNKEESTNSDSKESDSNSSNQNANAIETMLMNKNGKKSHVKVYISDGPMKGDNVMNTATVVGNERERETTNTNNVGGMKGNLLQYSEPLVINSRYRTEHLIDRTTNRNLNKNIDRNLDHNSDREGTILLKNRDSNQIDYPPHYRLSYHPNVYSKRSLSKAIEFETETNKFNQKSLSNNEKRPKVDGRPSTFVYSNFPSNLIEVPTKQQVYFNSDDQLFETNRPLDKHFAKNKYNEFNRRHILIDDLEKQSNKLRQLDNTLIPSNYPRNIRYNPSSSSTSNLSSSNSLANQNTNSPNTPSIRSSNSEKYVQNQQQSNNIISQLIRIQPTVLKNTSVTYDSI